MVSPSPLPRYPLADPPEPAGRDTDWRLPAFRIAVGALVVGFVALAAYAAWVMVTAGGFQVLTG